MNTRTSLSLAAGLTGLALLNLAQAAQAQVVPGDINKTQIRPSAHGLGLGGSYLLLDDDPNGIITNPAAVGLARRASPLGLDLAAEGQTSNVNIKDLTSLVNKLKDLRDQINSTPANSITTLQNVEGSFNDVYNFARDNAGNGSQARLSGSLSIGAAARWTKIGDFSVGTVAYDGIAVDTRLTPSIDNTTAPPTVNGQTLPSLGNRALAINGGALNLATIGIPVAYQLPGMGGTIGLTPKYVRADYAAFTGNANEHADTINGADFNEVNHGTFDLDAGYTSSHFTFAGYTVQGAAVVRHLVAPKFNLSKSINNYTPGFAGAGPGNFDFTLNPEVDLGGAVSAYGARLVAEVHDLNAANGGGKTFHVGAEYAAFKSIVPRIGYDNNAFVYGLGLAAGPLTLNVAASTDPTKRAAVDLSFNMGL